MTYGEARGWRGVASGQEVKLETTTPGALVFTWEGDLDLLLDRSGRPYHYSPDKRSPIFFYGGWLSSFYGRFPFTCPMHTLADESPTKWPTREHWFQAHKTEDLDVRHKIASCARPEEAKALGQSRTLFRIREDWDDGYSYDVMYHGIVAQHEEHVRLGEALEHTGDRFIAEDSPRDFIWGIRDRDGGWTGRNWLGAAWMEARRNMRLYGPFA